MGYRAKPIHTAALGLALALPAGHARAADLGDATLSVSRGPGAETCPDDEGLRLAVERVGTQVDRTSEGSLDLHVRVERDGARFRATIRASGRKTGVRELDVPGETCEPLTDAVAVTLALLMDRELREDSAETKEPSAAPPEPKSEEPAAATGDVRESIRPERRLPKRAAAPSPGPPTRLGFALDGSLTQGLPDGWSMMAAAGLDIRSGFWSVGAAGFWTPSRRLELSPGEVEVRLAGLRLRGCGRIWGEWAALYASGCIEGAMAQLRGEGMGFATDRVQRRPWYGLGASLRAGGPISGPVGWELGAGVLGSLQRESFSVDDVGEAYETQALTFFAGPQVFVYFL